jgi:hypothetical protein
MRDNLAAVTKDTAANARRHAASFFDGTAPKFILDGIVILFGTDWKRYVSLDDVIKKKGVDRSDNSILEAATDSVRAVNNVIQVMAMRVLVKNQASGMYVFSFLL